MSSEFPSAVPEIPVTDMAASLKFYEEKLGFTVDWGRDGGGIAGISQGRSRIFLTDRTIRDYFRNHPPVVVWLNLDSKEEVNELYERWKQNGAAILRPPESNASYRLHEFRIADPDGNVIRAFFTF
jgi:predicted lactoylglutathione lyase